MKQWTIHFYLASRRSKMVRLWWHVLKGLVCKCKFTYILNTRIFSENIVLRSGCRVTLISQVDVACFNIIKNKYGEKFAYVWDSCEEHCLALCLSEILSFFQFTLQYVFVYWNVSLQEIQVQEWEWISLTFKD